ncbi:MAG TPA: hypothetical protein DEP28_02620 [Bacteroidetes bacterium]|nr:hypothetical protein [Bacteroidota bacterium]HCN36346.1 hypothetical protein [Bacteroidota bacterium]HRE42274.1 peptidoglycan-binding domain-containing protein [Ignavibacteria bacterium]
MTGNDLLNICKTKEGQKYILGAFAPKDDPKYNGPWDCAELPAWGIYQVGKFLFGCTNNKVAPNKADAYSQSFKGDAEKHKTIIPLSEALKMPGAIIGRAASTGRIGHVAIVAGNGKTFEAHSKNKGVIFSTSSGRTWDFALTVPGFKYEKLPSGKYEQPKIVYRHKKPMMVSKCIGDIQSSLNSFLNSNLVEVDNRFGIKTELAVFEFQKLKGLVVDGMVGPETANALNIKLY